MRRVRNRRIRNNQNILRKRCDRCLVTGAAEIYSTRVVIWVLTLLFRSGESRDDFLFLPFLQTRFESG